MNAQRLKNLMYGLLYPAVLGTGLVAIATRISTHISAAHSGIDNSVVLGSLFLVFFCASFVAADDGTYCCKAFLLDVVEVILMFLCFYYLGLFEEDNPKPWMAGAYATFMVLQPLQLLWREVVGLDPEHLLELRFLMLIAFAVGLLFSDRIDWMTPAVSVTSLLLIYLYVFSPVWYLKFRSCR